MKKTGGLSFRIDAKLEAAIHKAAADDRRSVSWWCTLALERVLQEQGYLPTPKGRER